MSDDEGVGPPLLDAAQHAANMQAAGAQPPNQAAAGGAGGGAANQGQPAPPPAAQGQIQQDLQALAAAQGHEQAYQEAVDRIRVLQQQLADRGDDSVLGAIDFTAAGSINRWTNSPTDKDTAEDWLESVNTVRGIKTWTPQQTLQAMVFNLGGEARTWYTTKKQDVDGDPVDTLETFTTAFLERFRTLKTPSEVISLISHLKQKPGESVQAFWDRVHHSFHEATKREMLELGDNADAKRGARLFARGLAQKFYVAGLKEDLQRLITAQLSGLPDGKALLRKCVELEASQNNRKATIGELSTREQDMLKELNALRSQVANTGKGSGTSQSFAKATKSGGSSGANRNKNAKPKSTKPFIVDPERVAKRREWVYCHGCYTWGKHFQRECKATTGELRTLRQQNGREKPEGNATDRYYR